MAAAAISVLIFSEVSFGQCCLEKQMKDNCTILFGKQSSAIHTGTLHDARVDGWIEGRRGAAL